jgi:Protein of unknown function (DUF3147)
MKVHTDFSALKNTRWYELGVRFLLGGLITAATGIIGKKYGPTVGGLFLAFPAIFPASATLIDKHEKERKQRAGFDGRARARQAVSVDAAGAAIGSIGLLAFALLMAELVARFNPWLALVSATLLWMALSVLIWHIRKRI